MLLVAFSVPLIVVGWLAGEPLALEWRHARIRRRPFAEAWREILRRSVPYFRLLPADLRFQLNKHIQVFLAEKPFVGCAGLGDRRCGRGVVIHEFARQLDQQNGQANGAHFVGRAWRLRWARVLGDEFARLHRASRDGLPSLLSYYGATNPTEFFAVASEAFFEQARRMGGEHPELYGELSRFYRVDSLSW